MALGAFLAGLLLAETEFALQVRGGEMSLVWAQAKMSMAHFSVQWQKRKQCLDGLEEVVLQEKREVGWDGRDSPVGAVGRGE